mgnify:FL=1
MTPLKKTSPLVGKKIIRRSKPVIPVKKGVAATESTSQQRKAAEGYPVVTRKKSDSTSRQAVGTQPRRRVLYSVNENGVETRLPSIPILRFSWQWISGILVILLFIFVILLVNSPLFKVNSFVVQGLTRYSVEDFEPLLTGKQMSIFIFDRKQIKQEIAATYPELTQLQVDVSMPNQLLVSAAERQPIISWVTADQEYWIDAEGVVMTPRGESPELLTVQSVTPPPLVQINIKPEGFVDFTLTALEPETDPSPVQPQEQRIDPDVFYTVLSMNAAIPEGASLVFDPISGMGWRDPGGWEVYFGTDVTNIGFKMIEYNTILAHLQEMGVTPAMISVEHVDAPYFRME